MSLMMALRVPYVCMMPLMLISFGSFAHLHLLPLVRFEFQTFWKPSAFTPSSVSGGKPSSHSYSRLESRTSSRTLCDPPPSHTAALFASKSSTTSGLAFAAFAVTRSRTATSDTAQFWKAAKTNSGSSRCGAGKRSCRYCRGPVDIAAVQTPPNVSEPSIDIDTLRYQPLPPTSYHTSPKSVARQSTSMQTLRHVQRLMRLLPFQNTQNRTTK
ncbi:hypothetical protein K504DRAFT_55482 [Pleomassaria siparia CBS 279.74]|uniref:Uncharacterized protein n=1 Tax=Pleomassaria siparia CBS 279.74 TaxID=1314801 RepID=A0A6G1K4I9_9PLEO|nr:hypothetical protein K504DRAFT_55482 [Pleomassaria siparia CBS 279.74]